MLQRSAFIFLMAGVLGACGPTVSGADIDASTHPADAPQAGGSCTGSDITCSGSNVMQCQGGTLVNTQTCQSPQVCAPGLGCAACDPTEGGKACKGSDVYNCNADGTFGSMVQSCGSNTCSFGICSGGGTTDCDQGSASAIYVVSTTINLNTGSSTDQFLKFSPTDGNTFTQIGHGNLSCPASAPFPSQDPGDGVSHPYSMSVDREGRAWVLYNSGEIMWVKLADATCTKSPWQSGSAGFQLFGMGFVSDAAGSSDERLFIAGGGSDAANNGGNIGYIDPMTYQATSVGPFARAENSPELTGTGMAELYGYYPGQHTTYVSRINQQTGADDTSAKWALPSLSAQVVAWAFAQYAGKFYIFVSTDDSGAGLNVKNQVYLLDPSTGSATVLLANTPYTVVGAGVSTCAPSTISRPVEH
jgi:hypothetical protein